MRIFLSEKSKSDLDASSQEKVVKGKSIHYSGYKIPLKAGFDFTIRANGESIRLLE